MYKIVQNEYKIMIQFFYVETALGGGAACHQPPKFELPTAQEDMAYKIWESMYKIVQNKYKIMVYFSFSKSVLVGAGYMHLMAASLYRQSENFESNQTGSPSCLMNSLDKNILTPSK